MKLTVNQVKALPGRIIMQIDSKQKYDRLREHNFRMTSKWYGNCVYCISNGTYWSSANITELSTGAEHTVIEYDDIIFDNNFEPLIFN